VKHRGEAGVAKLVFVIAAISTWNGVDKLVRSIEFTADHRAIGASQGRFGEDTSDEAMRGCVLEERSSSGPC
jgi:hypothetical protein